MSESRRHFQSTSAFCQRFSLMMLKLKFISIFAFIIFCVWNAAQGDTLSECPERDLDAAKAVNRRCFKSCPSNMECRNGLKCVCSHECGLSCTPPDVKCKTPKKIRKMERVEIVRKNSTGHYNLAKKPYKFNDMATYICKPGSVLYKEVTHLCTERGDWSNNDKSICTFPCSERDDSKVPVTGTTCGTTCFYNKDCPAGTKCRCDGICGRSCVNLYVSCGDAPPSADATINYHGKGFYRVAYYRCNEGFYFSTGTPSRKCTGRGTWDGQLISCQPVVCPDLQTSIESMNGEIANYHKGPYYVNTTFTLKCRGYHDHRGARTRTCQSNGRWSGLDTVCDQKRELNSEPRCPHPGTPIGGNTLPKKLSSDDLKVGSIVEFQCDKLLVMVGEPKQVCLYNYEWSDGGAPQCVDPRYRDSSASAFRKLSESARNIQSSTQGVGRFISKTVASHEIYFLIDLSESVNRDALKYSLTFAVKLIERLSADSAGVITYGVIAFASQTETIASTMEIPRLSTKQVIDRIVKIGQDRATIQKKIHGGTNTDRALLELASEIEFSYQQDNKSGVLKERHIFILTDGQHNEGGHPQRQVERMRAGREDNPPTFYSITSCQACASTGTSKGKEAYEELLGLADGKLENYIVIENFYQISELLDRVTDARIDFRKCGQAGDVGSVRRKANPGRVIGGKRASARSWPWQVLISFFSETVINSYSNDNIVGGGSLINNRWVLTAAHLFGNVDRTNDYWKGLFLLTLGMHQRPLSRDVILEAKVKVFLSADVLEHPEYGDKYPFNYDVALMKLGKEYKQERFNFVPTGVYGWVNYTEYIRPVCLPCMKDNCVREYLLRENLIIGNETEEKKCEKEADVLLKKPNVENVLAVATGFGYTGNLTQGDENSPKPSVYLNQAELKIKSDQHCTEVTSKWLKNRWGRTSPIPYTANMLCATSRTRTDHVDTCKGDSGGPLVTKLSYPTEEELKTCWIQIGIVSWGWGCGQSVRYQGIDRQVPGFYTNVMKVSSWIKENIEVD